MLQSFQDVEFSELVLSCREIVPERMSDTDLQVLEEVQTKLLRLQKLHEAHPDELSERERQHLTLLPQINEYLQ